MALKAQFDLDEVKMLRAWAVAYFMMPKTRPTKEECNLLDKLMACSREMHRERREKMTPFQYDEEGNN